MTQQEKLIQQLFDLLHITPNESFQITTERGTIIAEEAVLTEKFYLFSNRGSHELVLDDTSLLGLLRGIFIAVKK